LYVTRYGVKKEPKTKIVIPAPIVAKTLSKGVRKNPYTNIGKMVKDTNINLPISIILCSV